MSGKDTDFDQRKQLFEEIKQFSKPEQEELYRILKRENEEISENRNGIFFDLMILKKETIDKIIEWVSFCSKNRSTFESRETEINNLTCTNPGLQT